LLEQFLVRVKKQGMRKDCPAMDDTSGGWAGFLETSGRRDDGAPAPAWPERVIRLLAKEGRPDRT
jgi:hypothetical protein